MRVFVTGATGFVGTAVVKELIGAGHAVTALARSEAKAQALRAKGVEPHRGDIDDLESLRSAAAAADGVIHLAFMHGLSQVPLPKRLRILFGGLPTDIVSRFLAVSAEADRCAIDALGVALKGSGRPLVTTFGTMGLAHAALRASGLATENDAPATDSPGIARAMTEEKVEALASLGVRATMIRLAPSVHGDGDTGFVPQLIAIARKKANSAYVGDGDNRWAAVHRTDAARLFRLALERGVAGARYHAVADESIPFRTIADVIGRKLDVPVAGITAKEASKRFSFLAPFIKADNPASSDLTRAQLGWQPQEQGLIADLEHGSYFDTAPRSLS
ncbi:nucleoside-diphosphate-sugar epimerase [Roseiarcus fermentans]|uniref:Nucleoside-diphosphate-sugar epimerase n=1 Tax=Roseiarcus fermentans TaxID=1473586 RepID=A0A366FP02_9HYPH|nr:SDR family oxidoreductase [Roseiarcus fermentans]RBP16434.1 nucleoside-diphosphate-sugar epimerase [Roseiarcus fermentans]